MSTPDFSHIKKLQVSENDTARFYFEMLEGEPWIEVRHAGDTNKAYFNAILREQSGSQARMKKLMKGKIDVEMLNRNRNIDRKLYPQHVCTGSWSVVDNAGNDVEATVENMTLFLKALPNDIFDDLRAYCGELANFREQEIDDEYDEDAVEEMAGN